MSNLLTVEQIQIDDLDLILKETLIITNNTRRINISTGDTKSGNYIIPGRRFLLNFFPNTKEKTNYIESQVINRNDIQFDIFGFTDTTKISTQIAPLFSLGTERLYFLFCGQRISQISVEITLQLFKGANS
jgi:hypothetical protein